MITVTSLDQIPSLPTPIALTIGMFDGVHLGHVALFDTLKRHGTAAVITFPSHPSEILSSRPPVRLLTTLEQKLALLEEAGIDLTIVLPFDETLSQMTYDTFLSEIKKHLPFSHLVLGQGATLGKNREGDEEHIRKLEPLLGFKAHYLKKFEKGGEPVSSGRIRSLIEQGDIKLAEKLLGRPM